MSAWLTWFNVVFWGSSVISVLLFILLAVAVVWAIFLVVRGIVRLVKKIINPASK
jgi:uncharacterized protein HemY